MSALVHAQLTGLRTLRSTYALMVGVIGLVTLITGSDIAANAGNEGFTTPAKLQESLVTTVGILAAVACSLFAAAQISGEYRYGTITQRALASPRRRRLLTTALITYGMFALVLGGAALAVGLAVAGPLVAAKDLSLGLSFAVLAAPVTAVVLLTLIGVSVGMLCRSQPAAILVLVGAFVAEKLLTLGLRQTVLGRGSRLRAPARPCRGR